MHQLRCRKPKITNELMHISVRVSPESPAREVICAVMVVKRKCPESSQALAPGHPKERTDDYSIEADKRLVRKSIAAL